MELSSILILLESCPKHVEFHFQNKFEKFVHVVGFIIRKHYKHVYDYAAFYVYAYYCGLKMAQCLTETYSPICYNKLTFSTELLVLTVFIISYVLVHAVSYLSSLGAFRIFCLTMNQNVLKDSLIIKNQQMHYYIFCLF
jgi:hypothetical protein